MFNKLKELAGDNEALLSELSGVESNYSKLIERADKADDLVSKLKTEKSKLKDFVSSTKDVLGIDEDEELSKNTITDKLDGMKKKYKTTATGKEQDLVDEIENYKRALETAKSENEGLVTTHQTNMLESKMEIELLNATQAIDAQNEHASADIKRLLKKGLVWEDGELVYRNENGSLVKGNDGLTNKTFIDELDALKASEEYRYLFKNPAKGGSGINDANNEKSEGGDKSDFMKILAERKKNSPEVVFN